MVDDECAARKHSARFSLRLLATLSALPLLLAGCSALFSASDPLVDPDAGVDGAPDAALTECSSKSDGTSCRTGICLGGACLSAEESILPGTDLSIDDSNSTQTDLLDRTLDDDSTSRWSSDPDELPLYLTFKVVTPHYISGILVDSGNWSHCQEADVYLSLDGSTWGSPVASYSAQAPLPSNAPATFSAPGYAQYVKIVLNSGYEGGGYCYIARFRVFVVGL